MSAADERRALATAAELAALAQQAWRHGDRAQSLLCHCQDGAAALHELADAREDDSDQASSLHFIAAALEQFAQLALDEMHHCLTHVHQVQQRAEAGAVIQPPLADADLRAST